MFAHGSDRYEQSSSPTFRRLVGDPVRHRLADAGVPAFSASKSCARLWRLFVASAMAPKPIQCLLGEPCSFFRLRSAMTAEWRRRSLKGLLFAPLRVARRVPLDVRIRAPPLCFSSTNLAGAVSSIHLLNDRAPRPAMARTRRLQPEDQDVQRFNARDRGPQVRSLSWSRDASSDPQGSSRCTTTIRSTSKLRALWERRGL